MKKTVVLFTLFCCSVVNAYDFYVSPDGDDSNPCTKSKPAYSLAEIKGRIDKFIELNGYPEDGITVWIAGGDYNFDRTLVLGSGFSGTVEKPLIFKAYNGKAMFNSGKKIDITSARLINDQSVLPRLNPAARGKVYGLDVNDAKLRGMLANSGVRLTFNGKMMNLARYPNVGYGHIDKIIDKGAIYAHGRTFGPPPKYSMAKPIGAVFSVLNKDISPWQAEFKRVGKAAVMGYLAYDWYKQKHKVASIDEGKIKLLEYSRYGVIKKEKIPRRLIVSNLLCELDEPGEFYYDDKLNKLFFWAYSQDVKNSSLSIWAGVSFAQLNGVANVRFENLIIEGVAQGKAVIHIKNCKNVELAGAIIRNCSRPAVIIDGGNNCGIRSCDIYDVPHHLTLSGGHLKKLIPSSHYAINNHFTQVQAADYYGRIKIEGVGQIFRNNLVHNFIGQVMTVNSNDNLIEYNELFNIGIEEGDGGAIYSGAVMWSWGNIYRHNFMHHIMCVPEAHARGGIYFDGLDQGDTVIKSIFYKAAHRTVLVNNGAGHTVCENIFLNGHIGIYNTDTVAEKTYKEQAKFDSGEFKRGDVTDFIWRTEQAVGKKGWNNEPWISRYPKFAKIMNQEKRRFWPIECDFSDNCFSGNWKNIGYRIRGGKDGFKDINEVEHIRSVNNREISMSVFKSPSSLDFNFRNKKVAADLPDIQFDKIGLFKDKYRTDPPDKNAYRKAIADKFSDRKSYDEEAKYDVDTINDMLYFNTGKLSMGLK